MPTTPDPCKPQFRLFLLGITVEGQLSSPRVGHEADLGRAGEKALVLQASPDHTLLPQGRRSPSFLG